MRGQSLRNGWIPVVLILMAPAVARAGGFEIAQQSASAGGTGSAGTARSGDPVAAWLNPAALTDGLGFRAGLGGALAFPLIKAAALDGSWTNKTESALSTPAYVHLSFAYRKWALGLSFNVPFGSGIKWPSDWEARFESLKSQPQFFRLAPFFAYRFGPVGLSAGFHVDLARVETLKALDFVDTEGSVHLLLTGYGFGGHLSVFWRVNRWLDLGLSYKSRTVMRLGGDADFTVPDSFAYRAPDQHAEADFTLPDRIALGALARVGKFAFLLDVVVTLWMVYDRLVVEFENEETDDSVVVNEWSPSVSVRTGAEYTPLKWLTARLGLSFDQTPVPGRNLYPSSPDSHRIAVTMGLGFHVGRWFSADVFYEYVTMLERESTSESATLARYRGSVHFVGLGLRVFVPLVSRSESLPAAPVERPGAPKRPTPEPARSVTPRPAPEGPAGPAPRRP